MSSVTLGRKTEPLYALVAQFDTVEGICLAAERTVRPATRARTPTPRSRRLDEIYAPHQPGCQSWSWASFACWALLPAVVAITVYYRRTPAVSR